MDRDGLVTYVVINISLYVIMHPPSSSINAILQARDRAARLSAHVAKEIARRNRNRNAARRKTRGVVAAYR
jgi:hypothetical protein